MAERARDTLMHLLIESGIDLVFGNPGTTEFPFMDALVDHPRVRYILALHDSVAVGMAHGYALSSGRPALVNLHAAPGVHNAMGNIYNAFKAGAPVVLTAGQVDTRIGLYEPPLWGELVEAVRGVTKWAYEVTRPEHLPQAFRRAVQVAMAPPAGPVFLSLPMDVLDAPGPERVPGTLAPPRRGPAPIFGGERPSAEAVRRVVDLLTAAGSPVVVAGDGVAKGGAVEALVKLSEAVSAPVFAERVPSTMLFPTDHPHYRGSIGMSGEQIAARLAAADLILVVGSSRLVPVIYSEAWRLPDVPIVQIDDDPCEVGKNFPLHTGIAAGVKATLEAIAEGVRAAVREAPSLEARVRARRKELLKEHEERTAERESELQAVWDRRPISPARLVRELRHALGEEGVVVDESLTTAREFHKHFALRRPGTFFGIKGTSLGLGLPASLGVKLAHLDRPVVCLIGDGSSLYSVQALWTAARYGISVAVVVANNRSYRVLKEGLQSYRGPAADAGRPYPAMDLTGPEIDLVAIARGFGMRARRVEDPADLRAALDEALSQGPFLVDVAVERGSFRSLIPGVPGGV